MSRIWNTYRPQLNPPMAGGAMRNRVVVHYGELNGRSDPFLALVEDWVRPPGGFPDHPHRGFETVTYILEGELAHTDNFGHHSVMKAGDVQWMTAARGIIHSEMPRGSGESHWLQLWLNLPAAEKMRAPGYQDLPAGSMPVHQGEGFTVRVISGEQFGLKGPAENIVPVLYLDVHAEAGAKFELQAPAEWQGFAYMLSGRLEFEDRILRAEEVGLLDPSSGEGAERMAVRVEQPSRFVFLMGRRIGEPVVHRGPFIMNTEEELDQAFLDFRSGRFAR